MGRGRHLDVDQMGTELAQSERSNLALPFEEFVDDHAGNPCDCQARKTEQADEEKFQSKKHGFIV